jgi:hypothetical protein
MCSQSVWNSIALSACLLALPTAAAAQTEPPTILPSQEIFGPPAPNGGAFGVTVALDGRDLITARSDFTSHAYERDGAGGWRYIGEILPPEPDVQGFGFVVDLDEGYALLYGVSGIAGKVFVYQRTATGWAHRQTLTPPGGAQFDSFGQQIVLQGRTAIIGSGPDEVYAFRRRDDGRFVFSQRLRPSTVAGEGFATDLALDGDTAMIGTSNTNNRTGSVFVFRRINGVWRERQELVASDAQQEAQFGVKLSMRGSTAVIGALTHNSGDPNQLGQAYVFRLSGGHWFEEQKIANDRGNTLFGLAIQVIGERRFVISQELFADQNTGTLRLFERSAGNWSLAAVLSADPLAGGFRELDWFRGTLAAADPVGDPQRVFTYELRER